MTQKFGRHLTNLINRSEISQKELAARLSVTPSYISKIKGGQIPPEAFLKSLSSILDLPSGEEEGLISLAAEEREASQKEKERHKVEEVAEIILKDKRDEENERAKAFKSRVESLLRSIGYTSSDIPINVQDVIDFHGEIRGSLGLSTNHLWTYCYYISHPDREIRPTDVGSFIDAVRWLKSNRNDGLCQYVLFYSDERQLSVKTNKLLYDAGIQTKTLRDLHSSLIDFQPYSQELISKLIVDDINSDLRSLFDFNNGAADSYYQPLDAIYVKSHDDYQSSQATIIDKAVHTTQQIVADWINDERERVLVITGEPGAGKTTLVERLTLQWLSDYSRGYSTRIPILVSLQNYRKAIDFSNLVTKTLLDYGVRFFSEGILRSCDRQGMFIFILDGMDEMIGEIDLNRIIDSVKDIRLWLHDRSKIIITCRTGYYATAVKNTYQPHLGSIMHLYQIPYERKENGRVLGAVAVIKRRVNNSESLLAFLGAHPAMQKLICRPLFLELLIKVFNANDRWHRLTRENNRKAEIQLFGKIIDLYLQREVGEKRRALIPSEKKIAIAEVIAFEMRHNRSRSRWTFDDIRDRIKEYYQEEKLLYQNKELEFHSHEFALSMFLSQDDSGYYFADQSIHDYFCAHHIYKVIDNGPNYSNRRLLERTHVTEEVIKLTADFLEPRHIDVLMRWLSLTKSVRGSFLGANCLEILSLCEVFPNDLSGMDLRYANLAGIDFKGADLRGGDTLGTDLAGVNLSRAKLRHVLIDDKTYFEHANVKEAELSDEVKWKIERDNATPRPLYQVPEGMVYIHAGEIRIPTGAVVSLPPFLMDRCPVTNHEFAEFIIERPEWSKQNAQNTYKDVWEGWRYYLYHWKNDNPSKDELDHPVTYITYSAALAYAKWKGEKSSQKIGRKITMRLPNIFEWEWAARGGLLESRFPWGNDTGKEHANYEAEIEHTTPVGKYPSNGYGLYDMAGNIWEWCSDEEPRSESVEGVGLRRHIRKGGGFLGSEREIQCDYIDFMAEGNTNPDHGFRCVMDIPVEAKDERQ